MCREVGGGGERTGDTFRLCADRKVRERNSTRTARRERPIWSAKSTSRLSADVSKNVSPREFPRGPRSPGNGIRPVKL